MKTKTLELLDDLITFAQRPDAEWDEPATLFLASDEGMLEIIILDNNEFDVYEMIYTIASQLHSLERKAPLTSAYLFTEAWSLRSDGHPPEWLMEERDRLQAMGLRFADHPEAIELKTFAAIDAEGIVMRKITRGETGVEEMPGAMSGRIPDALRFLLKEALARG